MIFAPCLPRLKRRTSWRCDEEFLPRQKTALRKESSSRRAEIRQTGIESANHVETALGHRVEPPIEDRLTTGQRIFQRDILARLARERLGHEQRLREEALEAAGPAHLQLILSTKLLHAQH